MALPPAGVYRGPCGVWAQNGVITSAQAGITAYAAWLGQPVTYVLDYITDTPASWVGQFEGAYVVAPTGPIAGYTALSTWGSLGGRTMCLSIPACAGKSIGSGGATWAAEAAGTNDTYWSALGANLVTWGYSNAVLRIGREFNGNWFNWSPALTGDTAAQYIAGYQHIVTKLKAVAGNSFKFMWNPILATMQGQGAGTQYQEVQQWYPGSAYVDAIGLDVYDWGTYPTQTSAPYGNRTLAQQQANYANLVNSKDGLSSWSAFASSVNKPLAFPEWGLEMWLSGTSYIGGGDDPYLITQMANFLEIIPSGCFMQAYWEDLGAGLFDSDVGGSRTAGIQLPDTSRSTFLFYFGGTNTATGGTQSTGPGSPGGSPAQSTGSQYAPPPPVTGLGWEIFVRSYADYTTLLCQIPPSVYTTFQAVKMLNDIGSGSVTLNMDAPWWKNTAMGDGSTSNTILDFECLWQIALDGVVRFEFLGETITEQLVDPSEQRLVTVTGPGTAATLKWASAMPSGFPAIVLKLDGIADSFGEINSAGSGVLDTNVWNVVTPAGSAYITPVPQAFQTPGSGVSLDSLFPSGTLTVAATAGVTVLGSTPWDATDTLVSVQLSPVGGKGSATDASGNPVVYGTGLDGSELTQMYVESLKNTAYSAGFGLSATEFYTWFADSTGTQTHIISSATAYDQTAYAYWMITEQGGSGGSPGTFYFWTSPDGSAWTQQWSIVHTWDATYTGFFIAAKYDTAGQAAILSSVNSNVTTPSYQGNIFLSQSSMGIWASLLDTAQARGTVPFVSTQVTGTADSFGNAWTDVQNVQVTNGTDLYSLLQSFCATVNADYCMQPGFNLQVGQNIALGGAAVSLGADKSSQVIFREAHDEMAKQRTRVRNQIANQIGLENSDGHEISANSATSIAEWGQREGWFQTSALVDPTSMDIAAAAFLAKGDSEILSWTLSIPPLIPGKTIFENFGVGDWVGLERPDWTAVDAVRVTGIAVQVDQDGVETHELTLVSYLQWLQEQFTYVASKLGGAFVNALGTTPVAPSKYGTGQVPTWFAPAATLANLADVIGTGGTGGSPLVYNAATGKWQSATSADPVSGQAPGLSIPSPGGTVSINNGAVAVSAVIPAVAPDGGGAAATVPSTVTTPTGTTVTDSTGTPRVVVGHQSDGTVTVTEINGTAPATPDTPAVAGALSALVVGWDGLLGGAAPLSDFLWTEVHVSTTTGFTPSSATLQGTMAAGGVFGVGNLLGGTTYYARLVARNKSRVASAASTQASAAAITPGAGSGAKVTVASTAPGSPATGDLWYDTALGNVLEQWSGSAWTAYQYGTGAIATGAITTNEILNGTIVAGDISATAAITGSQLAAAAGITGSQISSSAGLTGTQLANATITLTQLAGAVTARALGGITTTVATTAPGSPTAGDMWVNTTTGVIEQWSGAAWVVVTFNAANAIQASSITASQILAGTITATQLAANSVTASQLAANSITAADMLANTITAAQIASGTITATQIATGTITAALLHAGIVMAGIVDATTVTGSTIQNSGSDPRTSINPDGSITITNSSGVVIFKIGPDGTTYWYNAVGALLMELQPGGNDLIYASATGPVFWDFEGSTDSWAGTNATLTSSSAWSHTGADSLLATHSNTSQPWGAHSPGFPVVAGTTASMTAALYTSAIVTGVSIGFTFWSGAGGTGTNLGTVAGDQGTFSTAGGGVYYTVTITGATVPATAVSATFFVQSTETTSGALIYIDSVSLAGGLVYSNSPTGGTDSFGNSFEQGINFIGLPGLTNVFGVEDPYGNQLAIIDGSGNISGQTISAGADVLIGGQSVSAALVNPPGGLVAWGTNGISPGTEWPTAAIGTSAIALLELDQVLQAGRVYELIVSPMVATMSAVSEFFYINVHYTTDGSTPSNSSPNYTSYLMSSGSVAASGFFSGTSAHHAGATIVVVPGTTANYRFLICANSTAGTFQLITPLDMTINDMGAATSANSTSQGTVLGTGSSGGSSKQTYTTNFYPSNTWSVFGNDATGTPNALRQQNGYFYHGGESSGGGAYNGTQYSFLDYTGDPQSIESTLTGATINWVELNLYCAHSWYDSGMYVTVGYNSHNYIGSPTSGRTDVLVNGGSNDYFHIAEGSWGWCSLPVSVGSAFASGAAKSIQLGPGTPLMSLNNYGYFQGIGSGAGPFLQINYTK